jgi:hypothetical protein
MTTKKTMCITTMLGTEAKLQGLNGPITPINDLFESKVAQLQFIALGLHGGYYEPKSNRDVWLANRIDELVVQCEFVRMNLDK